MKSVLLAITILFSFNGEDLSWEKGISVVQYNAEFNKANSIKNLKRISDANVIEAWIDKEPELKKQSSIRSVPTIIIYKDGKEMRRWEAGIMMQLDITYHDVQHEVDELTGANKF